MHTVLNSRAKALPVWTPLPTPRTLTPEPYLVQDEYNAMLVAQLAHSLEEAGRGG